jgi:hypothetical protein
LFLKKSPDRDFDLKMLAGKLWFLIPYPQIFQPTPESFSRAIIFSTYYGSTYSGDPMSAQTNTKKCRASASISTRLAYNEDDEQGCPLKHTFETLMAAQPCSAANVQRLILSLLTFKCHVPSDKIRTTIDVKQLQVIGILIYCCFLFF